MGLCTFSWRNFKFPSSDGASLLLSTVPRVKCPVSDSTRAQAFQWEVEQELSHYWKWFNFCEIDDEQSGSFSWKGVASSRRDNIVSCLRTAWAWCCTLYTACVSFLLVICLSGPAVFSLSCFLRSGSKNCHAIVCTSVLIHECFPFLHFSSQKEVYPAVTDSDICLGL